MVTLYHLPSAESLRWVFFWWWLICFNLFWDLSIPTLGTVGFKPAASPMFIKGCYCWVSRCHILTTDKTSHFFFLIIGYKCNTAFLLPNPGNDSTFGYWVSEGRRRRGRGGWHYRIKSPLETLFWFQSTLTCKSGANKGAMQEWFYQLFLFVQKQWEVLLMTCTQGSFSPGGIPECLSSLLGYLLWHPDGAKIARLEYRVIQLFLK